MCFNSIHQDVQCSNFGNGLCAALHVELATDIEDVFFRGVDAEDEVIGDLAVGRNTSRSRAVSTSIS